MGIVTLPGQAAPPAGFPQWEYDLLKALGAPESLSNLQALNYWAQSEGNVINNPLATSGQGMGATKCVAQCGGGSPIYEYTTEAEGVAQMAKFMGGSNSAGIVHALQQDVGLAGIYQAINSSKWCSGCQNGDYPTYLAQAVKNGGGKIAAGVGTGGSATSGGGGSSGGGSGGAATAGSDLSTCVIQLPGFLFFSGPCFLTKGGVKWLSGVAALGAGVALAGFGIVLLASAVGKSTGAGAAAGKVAKTVGIGGSLLAGQPEVAAGIEAKSIAKPKAPAAPKTAPSSPEPRPVGRIQSRQIERQYQSAQRQQGPIGPRGGNPTANRVASRERRGTSVQGARRQPPNQPGGRPF